MTSRGFFLRLHWASSCAFRMICWRISCSSSARVWIAQLWHLKHIETTLKPPHRPTIHNDCTEAFVLRQNEKSVCKVVMIFEIPQLLAPTSSFQKRPLFGILAWKVHWLFHLFLSVTRLGNLPYQLVAARRYQHQHRLRSASPAREWLCSKAPAQQCHTGPSLYLF